MFTTRHSSILEQQDLQQSVLQPIPRHSTGLTFQLVHSSRVLHRVSEFGLLAGCQQHPRCKAWPKGRKNAEAQRASSSVNPLQAFAVLSGSR